MSTAAQEIDQELIPSFGESYREARRRQLNQVKQMIAGLSEEEKKYLGLYAVPADERETRPAARKEERTVTRFTLSPATLTIQEKAEAKRLRDEESLRRVAERVAEESQRRERDAKHAERKAELDAIKKLRSVPGVKPSPREFNPIIGEPNKKGETPVKIDEKTTIWIGAGKDVQKAVEKWTNYMRNQ